LFSPVVATLGAEVGAGLVLMDSRARPKHRVLDGALYAEVGGVTADVVAFLRQRLEVALEAGVDARATTLDPGPDFAKTPAQTVDVLRDHDAVEAIGRLLLLALFRKD